MDLLKKYLTHIQNSPKRTHLYIGDDILFVTIRRKRDEVGQIRSRDKRQSVRETVILALSDKVYRLEVVDHHHQRHLDKLLAKIKYGSVDSMSSLVESLNVNTAYGTPYVRMTLTKLEYYL